MAKKKKGNFKVYVSWNEEDSVDDMIDGVNNYSAGYYKDWMNELAKYEFNTLAEANAFTHALEECSRELRGTGEAPCIASEKEYTIMKKIIEILELKGEL